MKICGAGRERTPYRKPFPPEEEAALLPVSSGGRCGEETCPATLPWGRQMRVMAGQGPEMAVPGKLTRPEASAIWDCHWGDTSLNGGSCDGSL